MWVPSTFDTDHTTLSACLIQATLTMQVSYIPPPGSAPTFQPQHPPEPLPYSNPAVEMDTVTSNDLLFFCLLLHTKLGLNSINVSAWAVISLDTLGEEDTESMIMLEQTEDQGADDGHSMVIVGNQGPSGQESPAAQIPKRSPPSYNTHGGLKKRRRGASSQPKQLPNKPQDLQVPISASGWGKFDLILTLELCSLSIINSGSCMASWWRRLL